MPEDLGVVGFESFKRAYQAGLLKGRIGEQLTRAFVQEAVRPLIGAVGGFAAELLWVLMIILRICQQL